MWAFFGSLLGSAPEPISGRANPANRKPPGRPGGFLDDAAAVSGPMVPMVVGSDQLVGHLLLLRR